VEEMVLASDGTQPWRRFVTKLSRNPPANMSWEATPRTRAFSKS